MLEAAPNPKHLPRVFSEDYVEANESSHRKLYSTAWRHSNIIQQSILSCGNFNEDCIRALTIALIHKYFKIVLLKREI